LCNCNQAEHCATLALLEEKLEEAGSAGRQQQEAADARLQEVEGALREEQMRCEVQRGQQGQLSQRLEEAQGRLQQHEQRAAEEQRQHAAEVAALRQELAAARQQGEAREDAYDRALQAALEGAAQQQRDLEVSALVYEMGSRLLLCLRVSLLHATQACAGRRGLHESEVPSGYCLEHDLCCSITTTSAALWQLSSWL
jgi:hypothetical protein